MNATKTHQWTIRTDAALMDDFEAENQAAAVMIWKESEGEACGREYADLFAAICDWPTMKEYIEAIDGAWAWIESDDAPDGGREYAGQENM